MKKKFKLYMRYTPRNKSKIERSKARRTRTLPSDQGDPEDPLVEG